MSRPVLKLPAKSTASSAADDPGPLSRKPVRSGARPPKRSVAEHASRAAAKEALLAAAKQPRGRQSPRSEPARAEVPVRGEAAAARPAPPPVAQTRSPEQPKAYPKRGIARSTGARAFIPPRGDDVASPPRPNRPRQDSAPAPQAAEPAAARRPLHEPPRLSKRIRDLAQCSRREADEWIENGWVSVDGVVVTTLGTRVHPDARVEIKEEARQHKTESVTILLNRPLDETGGEDGRAALELIRPENRWSGDDSPLGFKATHLRGLAPAGKLDGDSTGMLVLTQEGSVARRITGDETRLEKEYLVRVEGELSPEDLKRLNHGLSLDDVKLKPAQVSWQHEQQLRFVLHESRKRQIRRMCELVGLRVVEVKRIRIGSVSLGKLPAGQWRYLRENERF